MKLIFMGSAAFAVPSLEAAVASDHRVLEVVTQPDRPAGRGMHLTACPVAEAACRHGLPLFQPKGVKRPEVIDHLRALAPDLIVVVAYGRILPQELLEIPPLGCINVHASLLPKYRGAAPIAWAIVHGEKETGVTTQRIALELDAGDLLLSARTTIGEAETAGELHDRLAPMGAELLLRTIEGIERGTIHPSPQDPARVSHAPIIQKEDGRIDWSLPARAIMNRVRGFTPWPGTFTSLEGRQLKVIRAAPADRPPSAPPGSVVEGGAHFAVACGEGVLYLLEVQLEGKRRISAADFLRGHKVPTGTILE